MIGFNWDLAGRDDDVVVRVVRLVSHHQALAIAFSRRCHSVVLVTQQESSCCIIIHGGNKNPV